MKSKCKYYKYCKENSYEKEGEFCPRFEEKEHLDVKIGDEVIVDGCKGIIIREPYQIGRPDDPLILVLVWYGSHMGDVKLRDIQPTGKKYSEIVKIIEELNG